MKISPEFRYYTSSSEMLDSQTLALHDNKKDFDGYYFLSGNDGLVRKAIIIEVEKVKRGYYVTDFYKKKDYHLEFYESKEISGVPHRAAIYVIWPKKKYLVYKPFFEKGHWMSCSLNIHAGRRVGAKDNAIVWIRYIESLEKSGYSCKSFKRNILEYSDAQYGFYEAFKHRFQNAIAIIE
jgi:hypothetical protein